MIEVPLFATFREGREKIIMMEMDRHKTVLNIISELNIPTEEIAICLINGFHSKVCNKVSDADVITLFPPVGGG